MLLVAYRLLGWLGGAAGFGIIGVINFSNTITLGSVMLALLGVAIAGIFTIRSRIATIWRQEAEGERASRIRIQSDLAAEHEDRHKFEQEQRELRHALKNEIVGLNAQIKVLEAKTDLTAALEAIHTMNQQTADRVVEAIDHNNEEAKKRDGATAGLLAEIRDALTPVESHVAKRHSATEDRRRT